MIKMNHTSSCTTSNTRHDKNPVISHERGKDFTLTKEHIQYTIVYSFSLIESFQTCLICLSKTTSKYSHSQDRWSLNTGYLNMKCTMKGNKNPGHLSYFFFYLFFFSSRIVVNPITNYHTIMTTTIPYCCKFLPNISNTQSEIQLHQWCNG
jgi:hypothetical protein